jgi:hydroxymethylglutaryl-CoA lyase
MTESVWIREVGLRDGLQSIGSFMPTADKKEWIARSFAAGLREMEVCSFVPEKYLPQFKDAAEVASYAQLQPGLLAAALVPNLRGAQRALDAGIGKLVCITSATESFSRANLRRSKADSLAEIREIVALRDRTAAGGARVLIQVGISVCFGCPFEGRVDDREVCAAALAAAAAGADEISLADTAGYGDPQQVGRVLRMLARELPQVPLAGHFHDTRGLALANVLSAMEAGVRSFDASLGGLGGCPNSPGATGNVATEDLVFMLEAMGLDTGVDMQRLLEVREWLARALPDVHTFGHIAAVGLPKGFVPARAAATARRLP